MLCGRLSLCKEVTQSIIHADVHGHGLNRQEKLRLITRYNDCKVADDRRPSMNI